MPDAVKVNAGLLCTACVSLKISDKKGMSMVSDTSEKTMDTKLHKKYNKIAFTCRFK